MKNKFWAFIIAILIIAPTVVAAVNYFSTNGSPVNQNSISSIKMTDLYNEEYEFKKSSDAFDIADISTNMVQFFTDVNTGATAEPELPEPLMGAKYFKVIINNYGREVEYKYYFTQQPEYCYYLDAEGKCFAINRDYAAAFLNSVYGRSVFEAATLPVMTTPAGEIIAPTEIKWTYLAVDDMAPTYTSKDPEAASDTVYSIAEQLAVAFSIPASSVEINVSENGEELYNGLYENVAFTNIPTNAELTVKVLAKWYKTEDRAGEGEASYTFKCKLTDKPVFTLGLNSETVYAGDFVTVTAKNVSGELTDITCLSTPELGVSPVFYQDGHLARALIPLPLSTEPGDYSLKLVADGVEQILEFTVTERASSTKHETISSTVLNEETLASFAEETKDILIAKSGDKYFDGEFIYPVKDSSVTSGYGKTTVTAAGFSYTNEWVRVTAETGSDVMAMNAGKVVFVGEHKLTGKTVIIDHGMGLKSIYANMTDTTVKVDDVVATGDKLGVSGAAGYSDGSVVSVALVINGIYVSPYEIWDEEGVVFKDFEEVPVITDDAVTDETPADTEEAAE